MASTTTASPGTAITFTDFSTGNITSWSWDFGDGATSSSQNPSKSYDSIGTYTVSLTVTNPLMTDTETKPDYITITPSYLPGDANQDGVVNISDLFLTGASFNKRSGDPGFNANADFNGDGIIDLYDLVKVGLNFGRSQ